MEDRSSVFNWRCSETNCILVTLRYHPDPTSGRVWLRWIESFCRGQGRLALAEFERWCAARGYHQIHLICFVNNIEPEEEGQHKLRFYQAAGYNIATEKQLIGDFYSERSFHFWKPL